MGDALQPTINEGDVLLSDRSHTKPQSGQLFVLHTPDGLIVKRLRRTGCRWMLISDNPAYEPRPVGISVRVRGVDTPEIRGKCDSEKARARQAWDYVKALLGAAQQVELRDIERGKYFRLVAAVESDGQYLAATLIEAGYGWPYTGGRRRGWCSDAP